MNRDDIINLLREATHLSSATDESAVSHIVSDETLQRFAALVAAEEREQCAWECEMAGINGYGTLMAAQVIRKRGESNGK